MEGKRSDRNAAAVGMSLETVTVINIRHENKSTCFLVPQSTHRSWIVLVSDK